MAGDDDFDFSIKTVPDSWNKADPGEKVHAGFRPQKPANTATLPSRQKADLFSAGSLGLAVSLAAGVSWYLLENQWDEPIWWAPAAIGLLIAITVRISTGAQSSGLRCGLSLALYCMTILITGVTLARRHLLDQSASVDFRSLESQLTFDLFTRGDSITGVAAGAIAIFVLSIGLSK